MKLKYKLMLVVVLVLTCISSIIGCGASYLKEADSIYETGDYRTARNAYRAIIKEHPESAQAHYMLGKALEQLGDKDAAASFKKALELNSSHKGAKEEVKKTFVQDGDEELKRKEFNEALRNYRNAYELDERDMDVTLKLADAYSAYGSLIRAEEFYDKVITGRGDLEKAKAGKSGLSKKRTQASSYFEKGKKAYDAGSFSSAKKHLDRAIMNNRDDPEIRYHSFMSNGIVLYQKGDTWRIWDGIMEINKAAEIKQTSAEPHYYLGLSYHKLDDKDFENILTEFEKSLELEPDGKYSSRVKKELAKHRKRKKMYDEFWGK